VGKIIIDNLRCINHLEFEVPSKQGVYLLVGANGRGKSSILTCLDKICNSCAFQYGFRALPKNERIDSFENTKITYQSGSLKITYTKKNQRWVASPLKDVTPCLKGFNYSDTLFISADPTRISYTSDNPGNRKQYIAVEDFIKDKLNYLFNTTKYNDLKIIRTPSGYGRHKNEVYCIKSSRDSYTEKQFSSGELAIIKLLQKFKSLKNRSLILIDEAELALHPRTQKKLFILLNELANDKNLLIILATHSPTLIYQAKEPNILLLTANEIVNPCSHAMALGDIDVFQPNYIDNVYFVEDDMAMAYLECVKSRYHQIHPSSIKFSRIYCVGGYRETAKLGIALKNDALAQYNVIVFLDNDVADTQKLNDPNAQKDVDIAFRDLYFKNRSTIKILPVTPEVGLVEYIKSILLQGKLRKEYFIDEESIKASIPDKIESRSKYKEILRNIVKAIIDRNKTKTEVAIHKELISMYVSSLDETIITGLLRDFE